MLYGCSNAIKLRRKKVNCLVLADVWQMQRLMDGPLFGEGCWWCQLLKPFWDTPTGLASGVVMIKLAPMRIPENAPLWKQRCRHFGKPDGAEIGIITSEKHFPARRNHFVALSHLA